MNTTNCLRELNEAYRNGEYAIAGEESAAVYTKYKTFSSTHIFDKEQSVKWNQNKTKEWNLECMRQRKILRNRMDELHKKLRKDVIQSLQHDFNFSEQRAKYIEEMMWDEYHCDMNEYLDNVEAYGEWISQMPD